MTHVPYGKVIDASADKLWAKVLDFGGLDTWFPFVSRCELKDGALPGQVGAVRTNTVADGALIEETLLELPDRDRRILYGLTKGDVPTIDYSSTRTVHRVAANDRAYVEWSASFDVAGEIAPVADWVRDGIFKTCLEELERVLLQDRTPCAGG